MKIEKTVSFFNKLFHLLETRPEWHCPQDSEMYSFLDNGCQLAVDTVFAEEGGDTEFDFGPFSKVVFPFVKMGAINSRHLFGLDELILFSFYWKNRKNYQRSVDIGANLGLHSIVMAKLGWAVTSYEPDPVHMEILRRNLTANQIRNVTPVLAAVSNREGTAEFTRVLGNTTGSHLSGSKQNPYGELDKFEVKITNIRDVVKSADFLKVDAEGHEKEILLAIADADWKHLDCMVEVGSPENAKALFDHLSKLKVPCYSQKTCWKLVTEISQMPVSYKEGSLFIGGKNQRSPWAT